MARPERSDRTLHSLNEAEISPRFIPAVSADGSLYPIEKMEAHRRAALHLAVSVFVFSGDALLLQRRAEGKYHCAGLWANTCCSHPFWNEAVEAAAERRLREELGLTLSLTPGALIDYSAAVTDGLWENERVQVFYAQVDRHQVRVDLDPAEVSEISWRTRGDIDADLAAHPETYAPWFRIYMARWPELGLPKEGFSAGFPGW